MSLSLEEKENLLDLSLDDIKERLLDMGEKPFRAKQIYKWLWQKGAREISAMTDLSVALREKLEERYSIHKLVVDTAQHSEDGTIKYRFKLYDGHLIEGVLIPTPERLTACISSQVGCSLSCAFCATGFIPRKRNLDPGEIFDQYWIINEEALRSYGRPLTNVVLMGMGEPLLNYRNVMEGVNHLIEPDGLDISPRRITLSTAGIAKMIRKMGDDDAKINLALSLHAATDGKRSEIMPINDQNSLEELGEALKYYYQRTRKSVTYEYILFAGFNNTRQDAKALANFVKLIPSKVNIIEYNPIEQADFQRPTPEQIDRFAEFLMKEDVRVTVRRSRGKDINAACGQLANK